MEQKQEVSAIAAQNRFDGDGRDEKYWRMRKYLLSCPSTQTLIKNAGVDAEMVLEILVHAHLISSEEGTPCVGKKTLDILEEAVPLISAELDQVEKQTLISTVKPNLDKENLLWLH